MTRFRTLIAYLALDHRDRMTLRHAAWIARAARAEVLYLAHIVPTFDLPDELRHAGDARPIDEQVAERLRGAHAALADLFPAHLRVETLAREGSFEAELARLAAQKSADLVCLGRLRPEDHDPIGDAAAGLMRKTPCSFLLVPADVEPRYERILVPVDFSESSKEALAVAVAVAVAAATPGASLTVLHVYSVPFGYTRAGMTYEGMAARLRGVAEQRWAELAGATDFRGVPWAMRYEVGDSVPATILSVAQSLDAQLIVMGSHGRTRPAATLLGHAADTVGARTTRPYLCVKRKGEVVNLLRAILQLYELE
jgi:nucleotide-binding universal stress UspA family protein